MNSLTITFYLFKRMFGRPKGIIAYLLFPTILMSLIVHFLGSDSSEPIHIAYANHDQGELSSHLLHSLSTNTEFTFEEYDEEGLKEKIVLQKIRAGFIIPENFSQQLLAGKAPQVEYYYLAVSETAVSTELYLREQVSQLTQTVHGLLPYQQTEAELLTLIDKVIHQQNQTQISLSKIDQNLPVNERRFLVIGFMLFFVMGLIMSSLGLVMEDRAMRTMARIYTTPIRTIEISIGYFLGSFGLGLLQIIIVLCVTKYILGYQYGVSLPHLLLVFSLFIFATVGIGTAVAGLVKNHKTISTINSLIITPSAMIGGCWWPISIMPEFMQKLANFVPQKWAIESIERLAAGEDLVQISIQLGILLLFGIVLLGFGSFVLKPSEDVV